MEYVIGAMCPADWAIVRRIFMEGIATGQATLETESPSWESWNANHLEQCRLVVKMDDEIVGWGALSAVSRRRVYSGVAEVSVYLESRYRGLGIGRALLNALIASSEQCGIWTLQAGILAENVSSLALHQRCGFREVGRRELIGKLHDTWRDVVLLERRSKVVGIE